MLGAKLLIRQPLPDKAEAAIAHFTALLRWTAFVLRPLLVICTSSMWLGSEEVHKPLKSRGSKPPKSRYKEWTAALMAKAVGISASSVQRMKRSYQRQTQVFDLPVPTPLALSSTIFGPPNMFLWCITIPRERLQTAAITGLEGDGNSFSHAASPQVTGAWISDLAAPFGRPDWSARFPSGPNRTFESSPDSREI